MGAAFLEVGQGDPQLVEDTIQPLHRGVLPEAPPAKLMKIAQWKGRKLHTSADGIKTFCGALIPDRATVNRFSPNCPPHVTCYNCAYWCTLLG